MLDYLRSLRTRSWKVSFKLLADWFLLIHLLIALMSVIWALLVGQVLLALLVLSMCPLALMLWVELQSGLE